MRLPLPGPFVRSIIHAHPPRMFTARHYRQGPSARLQITSNRPQPAAWLMSKSPFCGQRLAAKGWDHRETRVAIAVGFAAARHEAGATLIQAHPENKEEPGRTTSPVRQASGSTHCCASLTAPVGRFRGVLSRQTRCHTVADRINVLDAAIAPRPAEVAADHRRSPSRTARARGCDPRRLVRLCGAARGRLSVEEHRVLEDVPLEAPAPQCILRHVEIRSALAPGIQTQRRARRRGSRHRTPSWSGGRPSQRTLG